MISSELPEILRMSHRIVVMCEGRITGNSRQQKRRKNALWNLLRSAAVLSQKMEPGLRTALL